tara:strand:+ start:481 stop:978 length:498 start_codon:yes stop_codon:yes gene_type:complete
MSEIKVDKIQGTSGTSTAITLSGANATVGGTLAVTGVHTVGTNAVATSDGGAATTSIVQGLAKVWSKSDGTQSAGSMGQDTFNVTSFTDSGTGRHVITIANDMNSVHYSYTSMARQDGSDDRAIIVSQEEDSGTAAGSLPFTTQNDGGSYVDTAGIGITIHGDLA